MRPAWAAVLAALQVAHASQHGFSVHEDLLAYPQFQVVFPDTYVLETDAQSKLDLASESSPSPAKASFHTAPSDNTPSVYKPTGGKTGAQDGSTTGEFDLPQSYEYMVFNALPYLCSIPQVPDAELNDTSTQTNPDEEVKELDRARKRGSELLEYMDGPCLYYASGWWSYSFCNHAEVKQFRQLQTAGPRFPPVEDTGVPSYVLGRHGGPMSSDPRGRKQQRRTPPPSIDTNDDDDDAEPLEKKATDLVEVQSQGNLRYLVQKLDDGTVCDLTGKPRRIEVQYHCSVGPADKISSIKEISTCIYRMVIYTPRLCDDVAFKPPQETPSHKIVCQEIVAEDAVDSWKSRMEAKAHDILTGRVEAERRARQLGLGDDNGSEEDIEIDTYPDAERRPRGPIIGGIELGGMRVVGKPGRRIEPPREFAPPPSQQQGDAGVTIARFDPSQNGGRIWRMSDEQLNNQFGLSNNDIGQIEEMIKEMYESEPDRRWRIIMTENNQGERLLSPRYEEPIDLDEVELDEIRESQENPEKKNNKKRADKGNAAGGRDENEEKRRGSENKEGRRKPTGSEEEYFRDEL